MYNFPINIIEKNQIPLCPCNDSILYFCFSGEATMMIIKKNLLGNSLFKNRWQRRKCRHHCSGSHSYWNTRVFISRGSYLSAIWNTVVSKPNTRAFFLWNVLRQSPSNWHESSWGVVKMAVPPPSRGMFRSSDEDSDKWNPPHIWGRGTFPLIRFRIWPLFVTKNCIFRIFQLSA